MSYSSKNCIIAHRGSTYWTPEETEAAYRWARNIGADYLEFDLQLTKDNILVAFHDSDLKRTTNVAAIFPDRVDLGIHDFTLAELRSLDVGSWFNTAYPKRAKDSFKGLEILRLKDIVMIAEGYRFKRKDGIAEKELHNGKWTGNYIYEKDPKDNGNRPGIYPETKHPKSTVEKILAKELSSLGWNLNTRLKTIKTLSGKVAVANTKARVILQSFSPKSIENFEIYLPDIPKCFLLWKANLDGDLEGILQEVIQFARKNNVQFIGPSIAGEPNNYTDLTTAWMADLMHHSDFKIHAYTFDTEKQLKEYQNRVEAVFTNRADLALKYYNRKNDKTPEEILLDLGYKIRL